MFGGADQPLVSPFNGCPLKKILSPSISCTKQYKQKKIIIKTSLLILENELTVEIKVLEKLSSTNMPPKRFSKQKYKFKKKLFSIFLHHYIRPKLT